MDAKSKVKNPAPVGIDFGIYYTAGQMVINSQTDNLYNHKTFYLKLNKILEREVPEALGWSFPYPPIFLLFIIPFSIFPFRIALILWLLVTFTLAIFAAYLLIPQYKEVVMLVCGFPGVLMNLRWGQNAFLNTALIGLGFYYLDKKPILSGLMFGLLTYKPQIAFFPLLLLLITKNWKVLTWSAVFTIVAAIMSAILFGMSTWYNFIDTLFNSSKTLLATGWEQISAIQPSLYSVFRILGLENRSAIILIGIIAVIITIISTWVWRKTDRSTLKGTVLVLGIFLAMPYYMQYDLMILSIPLILLTYDCLQYGFRSYEIAILALLWFMPLVNWPLVSLTAVQICPFVLFAALTMTFLRVRNKGYIQECKL